MSSASADGNEQLLTTQYLNSVIKASQDDEQDEGYRTAALLARVILLETAIWRKDDVVARYLAGEHIADIARAEGVTEQTVSRWVHSSGVKLRSRGRPAGAKDKKKRKARSVKSRSNG